MRRVTRIQTSVRSGWPGRPSATSIALAAASLVCVLLAPGAGAAQAAEPMTFLLASVGSDQGCRHGCAEVIAAEGEIDNDTADHFVAFLGDHLRDRDLRPVVLIQSPGGTVVGAMQLGTVFRRIGAAVIVAAARDDARANGVRVTPGLCLSACVYAFMGGKRRVVPPVSRLGIHRMVINETDHDLFGNESVSRIYGSEKFVAALSAYTKTMGVDPRVIAYAETISPDALHIVTAREIARWRLGSPRL